MNAYMHACVICKPSMTDTTRMAQYWIKREKQHIPLSVSATIHTFPKTKPEKQEALEKMPMTWYRRLELILDFSCQSASLSVAHQYQSHRSIHTRSLHAQDNGDDAKGATAWVV
jgi:hypothetical protein